MIFYSKFRRKAIIDRFAVLLFLSYITINVTRHFILQVVGGVGNIAIIYLFAVYFVFLYGEPVFEKGVKLSFVSLVVFLFIYVLEKQFLYQNAQYYNTFGINIETHVWNLLSFLPLVLSAVFIVLKSNAKMVIWMKRSFMWLLLVTLVPSIVMLAGDLALAKQSATGMGDYIPFLVNYSIVYGLSVIAPYFFFTSWTANKPFKLTVGIMVLVCIFMSSFFIAIMATCLGIVTCFVLRIKKKAVRRIIIIALVGLLIAFVYSGVLYFILKWLSMNVTSSLVSTRLSQLAAFLQTGQTGDTTVRLDLYKNAIDLVLKHPITGNLLWDDIVLSGHSELLDIWGGCGIIALVSLISFFVPICKTNYGISVRAGSSSAFKTSTLVLIFVCLTNPVFSSPQMCLLWIMAPMLFDSEKVTL